MCCAHAAPSCLWQRRRTASVRTDYLHLLYLPCLEHHLHPSSYVNHHQQPPAGFHFTSLLPHRHGLHNAHPAPPATPPASRYPPGLGGRPATLRTSPIGRSRRLQRSTRPSSEAGRLAAIQPAPSMRRHSQALLVTRSAQPPAPGRSLAPWPVGRPLEVPWGLAGGRDARCLPPSPAHALRRPQ